MQGHKTLHSASVSLLQRLQHLQGVFQAADVNGTGNLDESDFLAAFKGHLSSDDQVLSRMFIDIDSNCDGVVNWEEFSAQLLMEKTGGSTADDLSPGSKRATPSFHELHASTPGAASAAATSSGTSANSSSHSNVPITSLVHADVSSTPNRWYSTGTDGVVQVWNGKDISHLRSYRTSLSAITSAAYLPSSGLLALGSYSHSLTLLDPATGREAGALPNIASTAALSLAAWPAPATTTAGFAESVLGMSAGSGGADGSSTSRSVVDISTDFLAVGDADGSVRLMQLGIEETAEKKTSGRFTTRKLWGCSNHHDWVVSVLHCPEISSIAAASLDKTVSLTDLERCIAVRTLSGHTKAVHCCTWNSMLKVVASGSGDKRVLLWNPFSCRVLGSLVGHNAPVVCLASNERGMQFISAAADLTVKVWDLRNQRCLQTLQLSPTAAASGGHQHPLSVMTFSPQTRLLVAGAVQLQAWALTDGGVSVRVGHREAVSWAGCIEALQEAVSTDHAGMVCCWDLTTGRLRNSFSNTHGSCRISTAAFDANHRRLITGAEDGSIKVWNFRSGALLSTLSQNPDLQGPGSQWGSGSGVEVTGLTVSSSTDTNGQAAPCIVATGWDRKVTWYADNGKRKCPLLRASAGPDSDVLAAAAMRGHPTLATACYNGEVVLWNLDSGSVTRKLLAPGLLVRPQGERAVESLAFMHGDLKNVLVAVGADCVLRFWDCHSGNCLEHSTADTTAAGHTLCAVALSPDNTKAVTADTAGTVTIWKISSTHSALKALAAATVQRARPSSALAAGCRTSAAILGSSLLNSSSRPQSAASGGSPRAFSRPSAASAVCTAQQAAGVSMLASWKAHNDAVTALVWVPAAGHAAAVSAGSARMVPQSAAVVQLQVQSSNADPAPSHRLHVQANHQQQLQQQPESLSVCQSSHQQGGQLQQGLQGPLLGGQPEEPYMFQKQLQHPRTSLHQQQQQPRQQAVPQHQHQLPTQPPELQQQEVTLCTAQNTATHQGSSCLHGAAAFVLSAGLDRSMVLWSSHGARVGTFGSSTWTLHDPPTWQDSTEHVVEVPASSSAEQAGAGELELLHDHSLEISSSSSSSDFSPIHLSPRDADTTSPDCTGSSSSDRPSTATDGNSTRNRDAHSSSALSLSPRELASQPASSKQTSPRQPGSQPKTVAFADQVRLAGGAVHSAAAAAVAAAAADAKLPEPQLGDTSRGSLLCPASVVDSNRPGLEGQAVSLLAGRDGNQPQPLCSALEEDLQTTLWLPEFAQFARPLTAAQKLSQQARGSNLPARPSTAAAACDGRLNSRSSVLAAAGRSSVVLGPLSSSSSSKAAGQGGGVRPKSAGWLQGRKSAAVL